MTNSYAHVAPPPRLITMEEAERNYRQGEFLKRNHHLISPWMYTPEQFKARNQALFLMHFEMAPRPMKPLAPGEMIIDELTGVT